jgi:hypothetical protein
LSTYVLRSSYSFLIELSSSIEGPKSSDATYSVVEKINRMHMGWCEQKIGGSICAMLEWKEQQRLAQESGEEYGHRPKSDASEIREMHEWSVVNAI